MDAPTSDMDPELAKQLFFSGATLVILGVPEGTEFGIDSNSWQVGPRFRGVKMVPPGVHFLHYSAARKGGYSGEVAPRIGFFLHLGPRDLRLLRWDPREEDMELSPAPRGEEERLRGELPALDPFLGPYPYESLRRWVSLSSRIGEEAVTRLQPLSGRVCAFPEVLPVAQMTHTEDRARHNLPRYDTVCQSYKEGLARLPEMKQKDGTEIRFTPLPAKLYPDNATPAEVTHHSMDLSYALGRLLDTHYPGQPLELLAELQFSFVCFLLGNVYEAFEQWKRLLNMLCRAENYALLHPDLYTALISVLYHQLAEIPTDFFIDIVSHDNFLTSTLQVLFSFLCSPSADPAVRKKAIRFRAHLTKRFQWDFEEEPQDCDPVIVPLPLTPGGEPRDCGPVIVILPPPGENLETAAPS